MAPPAPYYTNDNESSNAAIKEKVNYQKSEWPQFNAKMKEFVDSQMKEAEKAIIGFGEFRVRDEYKHLVVPVEKWNRMSEEQRKRAVRKFHSARVYEVEHASTTALPTASDFHLPRQDKRPAVSATDTTTAFSSRQTSENLSVSAEDLSKACALPKECLEGIWMKASRLVALEMQ